MIHYANKQFLSLRLRNLFLCHVCSWFLLLMRYVLSLLHPISCLQNRQLCNRNGYDANILLYFVIIASGTLLEFSSFSISIERIDQIFFLFARTFKVFARIALSSHVLDSREQVEAKQFVAFIRRLLSSSSLTILDALFGAVNKKISPEQNKTAFAFTDIFCHYNMVQHHRIFKFLLSKHWREEKIKLLTLMMLPSEFRKWKLNVDANEEWSFTVRWKVPLVEFSRLIDTRLEWIMISFRKHCSISTDVGFEAKLEMTLSICNLRLDLFEMERDETRNAACAAVNKSQIHDKHFWA